MNARLKIAMLCYPEMTLLDLLGPETVFSKFSDIYLVWKTLEPVHTDTNLSINPNCTLAGCPSDLDILFVPGGPGTGQMMQDAQILSFLRDKSCTSRYITSVCTGSLILAAAGLMTGYKATTHWSAREELGMLGAIVIKERVVIDGNRITGGGITSGIDFGLKVMAKLIDEDVAKATTLFLEYDPEPPFTTGTPDTADDKILSMLLPHLAPIKDGIIAATNKICRKDNQLLYAS
ncbi:DJ-1/PfpI family protein [Pseudomonas sp. L13]|uniref:DJ-1/PfpI family protein n=1 Tax=Pseudomonas sp. L13 TaxID=343985 RepID=UPI00137A6992|nr:DJ-1/PfpI family protein [Pseudomonas sp. L13]NCE89428.1 DJ-1/PfpI family protein [Pseudomonas sp. L13]